jgi:hypothetical protein
VSAHLTKDEALGLVMLDANDAERVAAEAHVGECAECRREWARAEKVLALMGALAPPPAPDAGAMQRTKALVHAELAAEPKKVESKNVEPEPEISAGRPGWLNGISVAAVGALGFAFVPHDATTLRYFVAFAAIGIAALLGMMAARSEQDARRATFAALGLSLGLGAIDLRAFALEVGHAESCFSTHIIACVLPLATALWLTSSSRGVKSPFHAAAAAACGAIAGQAVLLTACASEESFLHVAFFHVAGVLAAAAMGYAGGRVASRVA